MSATLPTPAIRYGDQLFWGLSLGIGAAFGIMAKSWASFGVLELAFFTLFLPSLGARLYRFGGTVWRSLGVACFLAFFLAVAWSFAAFAERMYFMHGNSYPAWLAAGDVGELTGTYPYMPSEKFEHLCDGKAPRMIDSSKPNGLVLLRCDWFGTWPATKTYIGHIKSK